MIVTTTNCIEGHNVKEYKGIVHGEVILGIDLDYETVGQNSMMMVSASGTAVVID